MTGRTLSSVIYPRGRPSSLIPGPEASLRRWNSATERDRPMASRWAISMATARQILHMLAPALRTSSTSAKSNSRVPVVLRNVQDAAFIGFDNQAALDRHAFIQLRSPEHELVFARG